MKGRGQTLQGGEEKDTLGSIRRMVWKEGGAEHKTLEVTGD